VEREVLIVWMGGVTMYVTCEWAWLRVYWGDGKVMQKNSFWEQKKTDHSISELFLKLRFEPTLFNQF
jgi:hypothetical protein